MKECKNLKSITVVNIQIQINRNKNVFLHIGFNLGVVMLRYLFENYAINSVNQANLFSALLV